MSGPVVPQVDVGSLSMRGLSAFAPMLAAMSADDVNPFALIQLTNLGTFFHTSGPHAERTTDLLQRCNSTRLDRLGVLVGWRKGDAASFMAQTAGGQAIALLCYCLTEMLPSAPRDLLGCVLYDLGEKILPYEQSRASIMQLNDAAIVAARKLGPIGFANLLSKQSCRIVAVFQMLGKRPPSDMFDRLSRNSAAELLAALSKIYSEEDCKIRINGSQAMLYIVTLVLTMFPDDSFIMVDGFIIMKGCRSLIQIEIEITNMPSTICVEITAGPSLRNVIEVAKVKDVWGVADIHTYNWRFHTRDALRNAFAFEGLICSNKLLIACCDEVLCLIKGPKLSQQHAVSKLVTGLAGNSCLGVLGTEPERRVISTCKDLFGHAPSGLFDSEKESYKNLTEVFERLTGLEKCTCQSLERCGPQMSWLRIEETGWKKCMKECSRRRIWYHITRAIDQAIKAVFIIAADHTVVRYDAIASHHFNPGNIQRSRETQTALTYSTCEHLHEIILRTWDSTILAQTVCSSTTVPALLSESKLDPDLGCRYLLLDGFIMVKGRCYTTITSAKGRLRQVAVKSLEQTAIVPSSIGQHSDLRFTVIETATGIEIRTDMLINGQVIALSILDVIVPALSVQDGGECEHRLDRPLSRDVFPEVLSTSLLAPRAPAGKMVIVQTKWDHVAQLLACIKGQGAILQKRCCLDCAVKKAEETGLQRIIVA